MHIHTRYEVSISNSVARRLYIDENDNNDSNNDTDGQSMMVYPLSLTNQMSQKVNVTYAFKALASLVILVAFASAVAIVASCVVNIPSVFAMLAVKVTFPELKFITSVKMTRFLGLHTDEAFFWPQIDSLSILLANWLGTYSQDIPLYAICRL